MFRIAVLTSHITTGAAVSSDALGMQRALERHGFDARLYAESSDLPAPKIWPAEEVGSFLTDANDLLIYHHSIGWDAGMALLKELKCRKAIKYHNITPPSFFAGVSAWHEEKCREGLEQFQMIAEADYDLYLSDSDFNQQELLTAGVDDMKSFVVPPFHETDRLHSMEADLETLDRFRDGKQMILSVSRVAPHKGHADLIKAFALYHYDFNRHSRLMIIGREEEAFAAHGKKLRELMKFLLLEENQQVIFAGEVSDSVLRALYLSGNVFVTASQHEGFGLPLVEAMAVKTPIVACDAAAISETIGAAGVLLANRDAEPMAEAINLLATDEAMNVAVGLEGSRRYLSHFAPTVIEEKFLRALSTLN